MKKLALSTLFSVAVLTGCTSVQNSINAAAGVPVGQKTTEYVVSGAGGILAELSRKVLKSQAIAMALPLI